MIATETGVCPVCQHELLVFRDPQGVPKIKGHRDPSDPYRRDCGGSCREIPVDQVLVAPWVRR